MRKVLTRLSDWGFSKHASPYWLVLLFDLCIVLVCNLLIYAVSNGNRISQTELFPLLATLGVYLVPYLLCFLIMRTYRGIIRYSSFHDLARIGAAMVLAMLLLAIVNPLINEDTHLVVLGLRVLYISCVFATLMMWTSRLVVKSVHDRYFLTSKQHRAFIYGSKEGGIAIAKSISAQKPAQFLLRGFFTSDPADIGNDLMTMRVYYFDDNAVNIMKEHGVDTLLVSPLMNDTFRKNARMQDKLMEAGIHIYMYPLVQEWQKNRPLNVNQLKPVEIEDLLPRDEIEVDMEAIGGLLNDKVILITGSAGSIGSEMVRQIAAFEPKELVLIDQAETPQHDVRLYMAREYPNIKAHTIVTSICNADHMESIFAKYRPEYVFHAAAYKHVPMMEDNPSIAIQNNILGTEIIANLSVKYGVRKFVMISTDKAVNPTNVMGCSKRICEMYVQSLDKALKNPEFKLTEPTHRTQFVTTRFGNVLGSNGSVVPIFREQIRKGGPVTVTHPDITRFFMLIPEACRLVLEAGTMGKGGEIFVFDMGDPVKIADLARRMITLSGAKQVQVVFTGLRDGEKLYEEVLNDKENTAPTPHRKIMVAHVRECDYEAVRDAIDDMVAKSHTFDDMEVVRLMKRLVPEYRSQHSKYSVLDESK